METIVTIAKALSEEHRLRVLMALHGRELCSCNISDLLSLSDSTVSTHMAILKRGRLVESRKDGRWVYYRLPAHSEPEVQIALDWIHKILGNSLKVKENEHKGVQACGKD